MTIVDRAPAREAAATFDARVAIPALVGWLTAFLATGQTELSSAPILAWLLAAALLVAAILRRARSVLAAAALTVAACALLLTAASAGMERRGPAALGLDADSAASPAIVAVVELTGPATHPPPGGFGSSRVPGTLVSAQLGEAVRALRIPVLVFAEDTPALDAGIGAHLQVRGTLHRAEPGDRVAWLLFSTGHPALAEEATGPVAWAGELRDGFRSWSTALPGDGGLLLPGLAIGDTQAVTPSLDAAMTAGSLSHLTAVSGANCAVVVAGMMAIGAALRLRLITRILVAVLALGAFVLIVTPQPSVLRAAVMALVLLAATATGRRGAGLPALAVAVLALLALDPWLARDYGFALSAMATAGLLTLAPPLTRRLARRMSPLLAAAIAVPTAAQIACQPILILLDPSLPLLSVPANLLAAPAAPVATVAGLVAALLLPVLPPLGAAAGWVGWVPASWIAAVARGFDQVPGRVPWLPGVAGAAVAALVLVLAVLAVRRRSRMLAVLAFGLAVAVVAALLGSGLGSSLSRPSEWRIVSCDVGQGAAALLRGGDRIALIDTGDDPPALERCLDESGVRQIDLLVLTHFDRDHVGAASALAGRVGTVLVGPSDGPGADRLLDTLASAGARVHSTGAGDSGRLGDLDWRVLWPRPADEPGNDASVVLRVDSADLSAVFLGDLGAEAQDALLRTGRIRPADVVSVAHHGSADQSPRLYEMLSPRIALVSAGIGNPYGHPTATALQILDSLGAVALRTDTSGSAVVGIGRSGGELLAWTARSKSSAIDGRDVGGEP